MLWNNENRSHTGVPTMKSQSWTKQTTASSAARQLIGERPLLTPHREYKRQSPVANSVAPSCSKLASLLRLLGIFLVLRLLVSGWYASHSQYKVQSNSGNTICLYIKRLLSRSTLTEDCSKRAMLWPEVCVISCYM